MLYMNPNTDEEDNQKNLTILIIVRDTFVNVIKISSIKCFQTIMNVYLILNLVSVQMMHISTKQVMIILIFKKIIIFLKYFVPNSNHFQGDHPYTKNSFNLYCLSYSQFSIFWSNNYFTHYFGLCIRAILNLQNIFFRFKELS